MRRDLARLTMLDLGQRPDTSVDGLFWTKYGMTGCCSDTIDCSRPTNGSNVIGFILRSIGIVISSRAHWRARCYRDIPRSHPRSGYSCERLRQARNSECRSTAREHLNFNISHTKSLVLLGVTSDGALGVDVENCRSREAPLKIAHQFFAPEELAELQALPRAQQHDRFFEYWTLKESYIKARGMGLSLPFELVQFPFP